MSESTTMMAMASFALLGLSILLFALLRGWQGWLDLKRMELSSGHPSAPAHGGAGERIEIADLKERIRKLESLAACIDI